MVSPEIQANINKIVDIKSIYTSEEQRLELLEDLLQQFGLNSSEIIEFKRHVSSLNAQSSDAKYDLKNSVSSHLSSTFDDTGII